MPDYAAARRKMVEGQLMPAGVVESSLLEQFARLPREDFVSTDSRDRACLDEVAPVSPGRFLLPPALHARLLAASLPGSGDHVLEVGCATGYGAAILSPLCGRVTALDDSQTLLDTARTLWTREGCANVSGVCGPMAQGWKVAAPYTLIVINGAVCRIPEALVDQLAPGGRLVAVVRAAQTGPGHAVLVRRGEAGNGVQRNLFDASCPWLSGFAPQGGFRFEGLTLVDGRKKFA